MRLDTVQVEYAGAPGNYEIQNYKIYLSNCTRGISGHKSFSQIFIFRGPRGYTPGDTFYSALGFVSFYNFAAILTTVILSNLSGKPLGLFYFLYLYIFYLLDASCACVILCDY